VAPYPCANPIAYIYIVAFLSLYIYIYGGLSRRNGSEFNFCGKRSVSQAVCGTVPGRGTSRAVTLRRPPAGRPRPEGMPACRQSDGPATEKTLSPEDLRACDGAWTRRQPEGGGCSPGLPYLSTLSCLSTAVFVHLVVRMAMQDKDGNIPQPLMRRVRHLRLAHHDVDIMMSESAAAALFLSRPCSCSFCCRS
jgi:hypothetical protein